MLFNIKQKVQNQTFEKFQILEDTCFATSDVLSLLSVQEDSTPGSDGVSVNFGVEVLDGEQLGKDKFAQSTPPMASARSISSKEETSSNKDLQLPLVPAIATENTGLGVSSFATGSRIESRIVVRSELRVVGKESDSVLFSQGVSIGSKVKENVTFVGPETLKVTETDIALQKKEKQNIAIEKHMEADYPTSCYKGCL